MSTWAGLDPERKCFDFEVRDLLCGSRVQFLKKIINILYGDLGNSEDYFFVKVCVHSFWNNNELYEHETVLSNEVFFNGKWKFQ